MSKRLSVSLIAASILAATLVFIPAAAAEEPTVQVGPLGENCMERYMEGDFGAVRVVSPNSCTYQVYVDVTIDRPAGAASFDCMDRYWESPEVAGYKVVSRSSCEYEVYYNGKPVTLTGAAAVGVPTPLCVVVIPADDARLTYCVDPKGRCLVSHTQTYIWGTEYYCDVRNPTVKAGAPDLPPLVSVCVAGVTESGCYRGGGAGAGLAVAGNVDASGDLLAEADAGVAATVAAALGDAGHAHAHERGKAGGAGGPREAHGLAVVVHLVLAAAAGDDLVARHFG
ncbi:MAG TPA: hypothetical protein VNZ52_09820, partial [Candidatus Thermoplasmatota archaeon]|nr:hypothetical protein [Candidatus Thermoplasmatota archaeon]